MKTKSILCITGLIVILSGCDFCKDQKEQTTTIKFLSDTMLYSGKNLISDTIIYDVKIKNLNPEDLWSEKYLKNLEDRKLIDQLFECVYSGKLEAYDYFSSEKISPKDLIKKEESGEINRNNIGKIQFVEAWYFDNENLFFSKKVQSITLGSEITDTEGNVIAYRSVFKVNFKQE